MPNLIWFEWKRCPDGYSVESLISLLGQYGETAEFYPANGAPNWLSGNAYRNAPPEGEDLSEWAEQFLVPKSENLLTSTSVEFLGAGTFLELADCHGSMPNTLTFVAKYGLLNLGVNIHREIGDLHIQRVEEFQNTAEGMKHAVGLWRDAISNGDYSGLVQWFHEKREETSPPNMAEMLRGTKSIKLQPRLQLSHEKDTPPIFSIVPENLGSALWLQFAQAVSVNSMLRRCVICPTWFAFGTGTGRRKSAHYCSDKCRKAFHMKNKAKTNG